jgi:hypothetical protein
MNQMTETLNKATQQLVASMAMSAMQDYLDNHELPDGRFAIELVGDEWLEMFEQQLILIIAERENNND